MSHTAEYYRERYASNPEARAAVRASVRKYQRNERGKAIAIYGGVCKCCGECEPAFLTFDHVHRDGAAHRRQLPYTGGHAIVFWAKKNGYPNTLQLLCYNCNNAKAHGPCPHEEVRHP